MSGHNTLPSNPNLPSSNDGSLASTSTNQQHAHIPGSSPNYQYDIINDVKLKKQETLSGGRDGSMVFAADTRSAFGWTDTISNDPRLGEGMEMHEHQARLPRLPVPSLMHTFEMYLKSLKPLLTPEELEHSAQLIGAFLSTGGQGEYLQKKLIEWDHATGPDGAPNKPSWLEQWWDDGYLCMRDALPININYFFAFEDDPDRKKMTQVGRAASLMRGGLLFYKENIRDNHWSFDYERQLPLDMSQYKRVFACTRIPGEERDHLLTYTIRPPSRRSKCSKTTAYECIDPNHILVICRNRFFWFDVFRNGYLIPLREIECTLHQILDKCNSDDSVTEQAPPVGIFTAGPRKTWAQIRQRLIKTSDVNLATLEKIQSAIMVLCLDASEALDIDQFSCLCLHGPGTNRWFDKMNLIVTKNGRAGMNFEHSAGDGATTLRVADEMYNYSLKEGTSAVNVHPDPGAEYPKINELSWVLPAGLDIEMERTYSLFHDFILETETYTIDFTHFGGNFVKQAGMGPDGFVQLAMQMAHFTMFGKLCPTYESASTRLFLHGRTETVRACTQEALEFCLAASTPLLQNGAYRDQFRLMKRAVDAHIEYMRQAKQATAVDRHLLGLRKIAEMEKMTCDVFADPAFTRSSTWLVSTSHCGSPSLRLFGFGPVEKEGFGVGYMIKTDRMTFNITARYQYRSAAAFGFLLQDALLKMRAIVLLNVKDEKNVSRSLSFQAKAPQRASQAL